MKMSLASVTEIIMTQGTMGPEKVYRHSLILNEHRKLELIEVMPHCLISLTQQFINQHPKSLHLKEGGQLSQANNTGTFGHHSLHPRPSLPSSINIKNRCFKLNFLCEQAVCSHYTSHTPSQPRKLPGP